MREPIQRGDVPVAIEGPLITDHEGHLLEEGSGEPTPRVVFCYAVALKASQRERGVGRIIVRDLLAEGVQQDALNGGIGVIRHDVIRVGVFAPWFSCERVE